MSEEQCKRFAAVFDKSGNGMIERIEFFQLIQYVIIMMHVASAPPAPEAASASQPRPAGRRASVNSIRRIDNTIEQVREDDEWFERMLPMLPVELQDYINSGEVRHTRGDASDSVLCLACDSRRVRSPPIAR